MCTDHPDYSDPKVWEQALRERPFRFFKIGPPENPNKPETAEEIACRRASQRKRDKFNEEQSRLHRQNPLLGIMRLWTID